VNKEIGRIKILHLVTPHFQSYHQEIKTLRLTQILRKQTLVANPKKLLSNKNPKCTPTTPPTITSSKPSSSTLPKSKGKYLIDKKDSIIKTHINPSNPSNPSLLSSPEEPLPSSPKPPLTVSTTDSIKFFPESYIKLSLKDSIVVS
jgi:hypothetical protein